MTQTEIFKEAILEKIEKVEKALPKIKKLVKQGKIIGIPYENMVAIDCAEIEEINSVNIRERSIIILFAKEKD